MFQLTTYEVHPETGVTTLGVTFDVGSGQKSDGGLFWRREDADTYLAKLKRHYILIMFEKYVTHAKILHDVGVRDFYRTPEKLAALDRCLNYNSWFQDKSLKEICLVILKIRVDLEKILPSPGNNSYESSKGKLLDMIVFCKRELPATEIPTLASVRNQPLE